MAVYQIKRVQGGKEPGEVLESSAGSFSDEDKAREEARRLAGQEKNPLVSEYTVWKVFPRAPRQIVATYLTERK